MNPRDTLVAETPRAIGPVCLRRIVIACLPRGVRPAHRRVENLAARGSFFVILQAA
jgi:hypothetical protein